MKNVKLERGITLIALIITIIVLLIIAVVTIGSIQNSKIIDYAQKAGTEYNKEKDKEESTIAGYESLIESSLSKGEEVIVTNPYEGVKEWDLAYICRNGAWVNTPLEQGDTIPEETTIVAYFYKTGKMITPTFPEGSFPEGEEYHMVIEGTGDMPALVEGESGFAWQYGVWISGENVQFLYVTELTICSGITSIEEDSFSQGFSLQKVTIASSVTNIGEFAFNTCMSLIDVILPNNVTSIGEGAFENCFALPSITIPSKVSFVGHGAFLNCSALEKVKILSTNLQIEKRDYDYDDAFEGLAEDLVIYVLNNDVAQELEGTYDDTTTVRVVTVAEMNEI